MAVRRGISILDLLPQTSSLAGGAPDDIVEQLGVLTVIDHRCTTSEDFFLHEGKLQSIGDVLNLKAVASWVQIPGLTQGLPFRLALQRVPAATSAAEEGAPAAWTLDIEVWDIAVRIPGLTAAKKIGGSGVTPLSLQAVAGDEVARRVFLVAQGVLRVSGGGSAGTQVEVVDSPDPFDPTVPTGAVIRLTARPPSFLFGGSQFGMTIDRFVIDLSRTYTPPDIVARGHDEAWEGVSFKETTFYCPPSTPLLHSLSISARDVIIGDPGGLQGELRVEFGKDFKDQANTHISVLEQQTSGSDTPVVATTPSGAPPTSLEYAVAANADGTSRRVKARFGVGDSIPGYTNLGIVGVWWKLPTDQEGNSTETPYFDAPTDSKLHYRLRVGDPSVTPSATTSPTQLPDGQNELAEVIVSFPASSGSAGTTPPLIDAAISATTYSNVVHLRGPRELLAGIVFTARDTHGGQWTYGGGSAPSTQGGPSGGDRVPSYTMVLPPEGSTGGDLVLRNDDGMRRVRIEIVPTGELLVGHQEASPAATSAVTRVGTGDESPSSVVATYQAADFHVSGDEVDAASDATIDTTHVTVPQGTVSLVEVQTPPRGGPRATPAPAPPTPNVVQILYNFDQSAPLRVVYPVADGDPTMTEDASAPLHDAIAQPMALGLSARGAPAGSDPGSQIHAWIAALPTPSGRKYFVVGRTDDLKLQANRSANDTYNNGLAGERRDAAVALLTSNGVATADIDERIETGAFATVVPAGAPDRITYTGRLALPDAQATTPAGQTRPVWNRRWTSDDPASVSPADATAAHAQSAGDANRAGYRCAEIYVVDTTAPPPPPPRGPGGDAIPVQVLVPGPDGPPPPPPQNTAASPPTDYRVVLRVRWDSPTVVTLADAIPTEAEALVAWKPATTELPATNSAGATSLPAPTGQDYWEIDLHWTYDARTSQTEATASLALPAGALVWQSDPLAGALAFGPAFTALLHPGDTVSDPAGQFVLAAALIGAGAVVGAIINTGGGPTSTVEVDKITIDYRWNGESRVSVTLDYVVDLKVNVSVTGVGTLAGGLKLKYKGVGFRFDVNGSGLAGLALTYDSMSVEVVSPGTWNLGGPLGNLIRIASSRMGNGSQWMEFDLQFALDLGVVTLEGATIRLAIQPFDVELRGLTASVDIDGVLTGRGSITVGDHGAIRALLALQIEPIDLGAYGALAVDQDFVFVEVGVQLPVGIPLADTGLGIFGFMGRFVANGTRNLDGLTNPDPVQRELDWYVRTPDQKYKRQSGQFAIGLGTVIGTLPDSGFTFNAEGSIAIGFPDVSVVFGIDAKLAAERKLSATEGGDSSVSSSSAETFRILGVTIIDSEAVTIAIRASYQIPKVLTLMVPISAYFPLQGSGTAWYIRIGTDNAPAPNARPGSPVTITLLPDTLDVRAWAFIMVEERQLHALGGALVPADLAHPLDFDGFSVGMGAGLDLKWSAGPFKLEISAYLVVGLGTKPLIFAGAMGVRGELDLVIISAAVEGTIHFHVSPGYNYADGHFCAHVDLFFFSIDGCVDIHIGDSPPSDIPEPGSPLVGIDLCDHLAVVKGAASKDPTVVPAVWPDTVPVLKFTHYVSDPAGVAPDFNRRVAPPAPLSVWSGSTELKYAFQLKNLELYKLTGTDPTKDASWTKVTAPAGGFDSAWWLPTHRRAVVVGGHEPPPSTEEGRELGLFDWDPRAWSRWLGDGSAALPGDPANTVSVICDPPALADPACAFGQDGHAFSPWLARFDAVPAPTSVFPSRFNARASLGGRLSAATLASVAGDLGLTYVPSAVALLHGTATVDGATLAKGYRLPALRSRGAIVSTLPTDLAFSKALSDVEIVLEVCAERPAQKPQPSQVCDPMPAGQGSVGSFAGKSGAKYEGQALAYATFGTTPAIQITKGQMHGGYPSDATSVRVDLVASGAAVVVRAIDGANRVLGEARSSGSGRQTLAVSAVGIRGVLIDATGGAPLILEVCWGTGGPLADLINAQQEEPPLPVVTVYDAAGVAVVLVGQPLTAAGGAAEQPVTSAVLAAAGQPTCPKIAYRLPPTPAPVGTGKGWVRAEIRPWRRGDVSLVAVCGVTSEASRSRQQDQTFRTSLVGLLQGLVTAAAGTVPTHSVYLDANTTYQLRVAWQYQGFRPANPGDQPSDPDPTQWRDASSIDRYTFRSADYGITAAPLPPQTNNLATDPRQGGPGFDESKFDPRGLSRYVTCATPTHEDPPHFLDDHVGFWFMVDHLEPLVEKYGRVLQAKVLHTAPAPGSMHGVADHVAGTRHFLDVTRTATKTLETMVWSQPDLRFVTAAAAAPCIHGTPAMGSASTAVDADLLPDSEYDLLLMVAPQTASTTDPEVAVVRSHFRTSHYRNPSGLLVALGFETPTALRPPGDAIATAVVGPALLEIGDAAIDLALTTLGMDPWPLPAAPRTTIVWGPRPTAGASWTIVGILIEGDEPIWRAGFKTGAAGEATPPPRLEVASITLRRTFEQSHVVLVPGAGGIPGPGGRLPIGGRGVGGGTRTVTTMVTAALGTFSERVRNAAGTRMLFVPSAPIAVTGGLSYDLSIAFNENGAAGASGVAPLFDRPLVVFQEGQ